MSIKIGKILKITFTIIIGVIIVYILFGFLHAYISTNLFGFHVDENSIDKHSNIFQLNVRDNIKLHNSNISRTLGSIYYYTYKSFVVNVVELTHFSNIVLTNIKINELLLHGEKTEYLSAKETIVSRLKPYLIISLYRDSKKPEKTNIYMKNEIEEIIRDENYLYIRFKGDYFSISSTEEYPDLTYFLPEVDKPDMELLILKEQDKTLFILKYEGIETENGKSNETLLDLVNVN